MKKFFRMALCVLFWTSTVTSIVTLVLVNMFGMMSLVPAMSSALFIFFTTTCYIIGYKDRQQDTEEFWNINKTIKK